MQRVGDDQSGFSFDLHAEARALQVKAWGFWSVDVATAFGRRVRDACREAPKGVAVDFDMLDLKPLREEGELAFTALVTTLRSMGVTHVSIRTGPLTKLQLLRLAANSGAKDFVRFS
jgi:hypothetical protein